MGKLTFPDGPPICHRCDFIDGDKTRAAVTWPAAIWAQWQAATRVRPELEIMGLFKVNDAGTVTELHIPRQEIEVAACLLLEQNGHYDGSIHSHHKMTARFSSMDNETVLPNYRYNIVTAHDGSLEASERVKLPCGGWGFKPFVVQVETAAADTAFEEHVRAQCAVKQEQPVVVQPFVPSTREWGERRNFTELREEALEQMDGNPDIVPGCHKCQVYYLDADPDRCWFCQATLAPVNAWDVMETWREAGEVTDGADAASRALWS